MFMVTFNRMNRVPGEVYGVTAVEENIVDAYASIASMIERVSGPDEKWEQDKIIYRKLPEGAIPMSNGYMVS